jgi:hypothetical protein
MALRRFFGFSDGELMRSDAKPCSRLTRQTAGIFTVGGGLAFWILCRLHYGLSYIFCFFIYTLMVDLECPNMLSNRILELYLGGKYEWLLFLFDDANTALFQSLVCTKFDRLISDWSSIGNLGG